MQSAVEELVESEAEHVIELEFLGGEETVAVHSSEEGGAFEEPPGVFFLEGEELSGCFSKFGKSEMDSPDFSLVLEAVLADKLEFVVDSFLFEGPPRGLVGGRI